MSFRFFNSVLAVILLIQLLFYVSEILITEPVPPDAEVLPCDRFFDRDIRLIFNGC